MLDGGLQSTKHYNLTDSDRKLDRQQAQLLLDLASKYFMQQMVSSPTHGKETLDLVFVNNQDIVVDVGAEAWPDFSDHNLLTVKSNFKLTKSEEVKVEYHLTEVARRYKALDFRKALWQVIGEELAKIDWNNIEYLTSDNALRFFHDKVLDVLEASIPKKSENPRVRRMKIQRMRRKLWKKHSKVEQKLKSAC